MAKQNFYDINNFEKIATKKEIISKIDELRLTLAKLYYEEKKKDNAEQYKIGYYRGKLDACNQIIDIMVINGYNKKGEKE